MKNNIFLLAILKLNHSKWDKERIAIKKSLRASKKDWREREWERGERKRERHTQQNKSPQKEIEGTHQEKIEKERQRKKNRYNGIKKNTYNLGWICLVCVGQTIFEYIDRVPYFHQ